MSENNGFFTKFFELDNKRNDLIANTNYIEWLKQFTTDMNGFYASDMNYLEELGLSDIIMEDGMYIVEYTSNEVIYSKGIDISDNTKVYKLSEIQEMEKNEENNINEENKEESLNVEANQEKENSENKKDNQESNSNNERTKKSK